VGTTHELNLNAGSRSPKRGQSGGGPKGRRTAGKAIQLSPELIRRLHVFSDELKKQYTELRDDAVALLAGRVFSKSLLPSHHPPGRPGSPEITKALELREKGVPFRKIPWIVIPDFAKMPSPEQSVTRERLRHGVYMRRKRNRVTNRQRTL